MFRVDNIMSSGSNVDNIYDLLFTIYIGKSIKEEMGREPEYTGLIFSDDLDNLYNNVNLINILDEAYEKGWLNSTHSFYRHRLSLDKIKDSEMDLNNSKLIAFMGDMSDFTLQSVYSNEFIRENTPQQVRNSQFQFIYMALIAKLLVLRYMEFNRYKENSGVFDNPIVLKLKPELMDNKTNLVYLTHVINYPEVKSLISIQDMFYINEYSTLLYYAWGYDNQTKGLFKSKGFTIEEKFEKINSDSKYSVNMPVLLYKKFENFNSTKDSRLESVELCLMRGHDDIHLNLEKTRITNTKIGVLTEINQNRYTKEINSLRLTTRELDYNPEYESFNINSIGIDGFMMASIRKNGKSKKVIKEDFLDPSFEEDLFIKDLDLNSKVKLLINPENIIDVSNEDEIVENQIEVVMNQADATFWLLKDWGVSFDEDLFKEIYKEDFEYWEPMYEMSLLKLYKALKESDMETNRLSAEILGNLYNKKNS